MGFLLELARLRGTETLQNSVSDGHDPLDDKFLRFLAGSSERPDWCIFQAAASQCFYRSICTEQWLLTVLTSNDVALKFEAVLNIQSNVVPSRAYLTKLEGVIATCLGHQCRGGFVLASDICLAQEEKLPQSCTNCALAEQLRVRWKDRMAVDELDKLLKLWFLEEKDVERELPIYEGTGGAVYRIKWRRGTFAMKQFYCGEDSHHNTKFENCAFNRELEVALLDSHPNIVHCFGCSTDCDLFMEVLEEDLQSFLTRLEESVPPFSLRDSLEVLLQVAEALKHLHENSFIHGDLKPGNILMSKLAMPHSDVPFYLVKVADFGCSQRFQSSGTATMKPFDFNIGSLPYTAPEVRGCREINREIRSGNLQKIEDLQRAVQNISPPKIDVFSFGVVANEVVMAVTSVLEGSTPGGDHLSSPEIFERCLAEEPEARPSFAEICERLSSSINTDHGLRENQGKRKYIDNIGEGTTFMKLMKTTCLGS